MNVWLEEEDASEVACASKSADDNGGRERQYDEAERRKRMGVKRNGFSDLLGLEEC